MPNERPEHETYQVFVWAQGSLEVQAASGEEAIEKAHKKAEVGELEPAPRNAVYEKLGDEKQCD